MDTSLIIVIYIAFIGEKYCGLHATGYVKIWPSSTKSLPTLVPSPVPAAVHKEGFGGCNHPFDVVFTMF